MSTINNELRLLIKNELEYLRFRNPTSKHNYSAIYKKYKKTIHKNISFLYEEDRPNEKIYCYINIITTIPLCCCGKKLTFRSYLKGYAIFCSPECRENSISVKLKRKQTLLNRFGVENAFNMPNFKKIKKKVSLKKYGTEDPMQSVVIKNRLKQTILKKYKAEYYMCTEDFKLKYRKTLLKNYNVTNPMKSDIIKQKLKQSVFDKYGVYHISQSSKIQNNRNNYQYKDYKLPDGKIIKVQGYEPFVLDILFEQNYQESQILTDACDIPKIWYEHESKKRRYFCDIYIPHENRLIEVKSTYTFDADKEINLLKQKASRDLGYIHEIWIIDKGKLLKII